MGARTETAISIKHLPERFRERYQLREKLGEGGVALVYRVTDLRNHLDRALKVLKPEYSEDEKAIARFEQEFRLLRRLHHPSLPGMHDYGIGADGLRMMVMDLVEGVPLDTYCEQHPEDIWLLLLEIAEALEFIHEHNLLHLDIKPANILVRISSAYGEEVPLVTLIDFGLSYRRESGGRLSVVGTPAYMAPEIISGSGRVTRAVDYYSFGITIFELLEGHTPFTGKLEKVLQAHLTRQPRFSREKLEYAELYPHVRALLGKKVTERLSAFEMLRRMLSTRVENNLHGLTRAYGMGYIDSLGAVGREELIEGLVTWAAAIAAGVKKRKGRRSGVTIEASSNDQAEKKQHESGKELAEGAEFDSAILRTGLDELELALREKLLSSVQEADSIQEEVTGAITDQPRTHVVTGPDGSGKSYLVDILRGESLLYGMVPIVMGESSDYESLCAITAEIQQDDSAIDPRSLIIDRFVRGWERLERIGQDGGALLVVDGFSTVPQEQKEFIEYVGKRIELAIDEEQEPGVFILAFGKSARLKSTIKKLLPAGIKLENVVLPLPGSKDIDEIVEEFRGKMPGIDDRKKLKEYLLGHSESTGALITALRTALVRNELELKAGSWRFSGSISASEKQGETEIQYYRDLFREFTPDERAVIGWLSCHPGWISTPSFISVSNIAESQLERVREQLNTYRIIDISEGKKKSAQRITSEKVRTAFYQQMSKRERLEKHSAFIRLWESDTNDPEVCESLAYHYEAIGEVRNGLLMRVRVIRQFKQDRNIFGLRQQCEKGIRISAGLRAQYWKTKKWHIERYFIKQWLEAEWAVSNFQGLIEIIEKYILKKKRTLPASFVYLYGMALRSVGEYEQCGELVRNYKRRIKNLETAYGAKLILLEAALLNNIGNYNQSLILLDKLSNMNFASDNNLRSKSYLYYIVNHDELGEYEKAHEYISQSLEHTKRFMIYDDMYFAEYYKILFHFNRAQYSKARTLLVVSIKQTTQLKLYFRLANMYHLLSGVYYEEGNYQRAEHYLNKAMELGKNLGIINWVNSCYINYSYIYEHMGYINEAISFAKMAYNKTISREWKGSHFVSMVQLMYLFTVINSDKKKKYKILLDDYSKKSISHDDIAFYEYVLGYYYLKLQDYETALKSFIRSLELYNSTKMYDDAIRCQLRIANIYVEIGQHDQFIKLYQEIRNDIEDIESNNIRNEYTYVALNHYCAIGDRHNIFICCSQAENGLEDVTDLNLYMMICSSLIKANIEYGTIDKAKKYFKKYYKQFALLASHMDANDLECSEQYKQLIENSRRIKEAEIENKTGS